MTRNPFGESKVSIPINGQYVFAFLLLTFLCYQAHETFHHITGAVLCGGFGTMTMTVYEPRPPCELDMVVTLSGPALSFAIAWFGAYLLWRSKQMLFAYMLIFASYAHLRFPLPLMRSGDEWSVARTMSQGPNPYVLACILFLLALPPLIQAYRSIANRQRLLLFIASWLMPFLILLLLPTFDSWLFDTDFYSTNRSLLGIPVIILAMDILAILLLVRMNRQIFSQHKQIILSKEIYS